MDVVHAPLAISSPPALDPAVERVSIVAVIVLYKIAAEQCISLQSLRTSASQSTDPGLDVSILLVDNSPVSSASDAALPEGVEYLACPENLGLANAYNQGILRSQRCRAGWLLTLDQDTELPPDFLALMAGYARRYQHDPSVAVILPQVFGGDTPLSPLFYRRHGLPTWFPRGYAGIPSQPVFGINSASMIRVDALMQAGGYDPMFWLDCSDTAIFNRLHRLGKLTLVAGDVQVQHELSLKDLQSRVSPQRYRDMLLAESAFWDAEMPLSAGWERTGRLAMRLLRQIRRGDDRALSSLTLRFLLLRLFRSARHRRELFQQSVRQQFGDRLAATALPARQPKVSVCMASYNSGHYIELQLRSILHQLSDGDEVVIIDDNSTDDTRDRIRAFADPRIRLIEHAVNMGVTRTFEQALRTATGDLLFLSDHDDIWAPDKVELFREAFAQGPDVQIVMSAVSLIDSEGVPFRNKRYDKDGRFQRGFLRNVLKNDYQGSALAMRSDLLATLLPFPPDRTYLHDAWIGTLNDRMRGGMVFLSTPLLLYRRHGANVSRRMTLWERVFSRAQLFLDHLMRAFSHRGRVQNGSPE